MKDVGPQLPRCDEGVIDRTKALRTAKVWHGADDAFDKIRLAFGAETLSLVALFVTAEADFEAVVSQARAHFPQSDVIACTTAGEIGSAGYADGQIIAVGFPEAHFTSTSILIEQLNDHDATKMVDQIALERLGMQNLNPDMQQGFAFLMVDGLSLKEDVLTASIAPALRDMPLFGGSAGDGARFEETRVALNGQAYSDAAILTLICTDHETKVFSLDHLVPTDNQMVVTGAAPDQRIVKSINAEPAAREYARIVGKDPEQLDRMTFASHPVVVRIGGQHHVRAIQHVNDVGELVFFSAIDEGMVLTLAEPLNLAQHLDKQLTQIAEYGTLSDIIGCDCILRRIEAEQKQMTRDVSSILAKHNVTGFSTYGEQIGPLHVNHTMTGVAIYVAPDLAEP